MVSDAVMMHKCLKGLSPSYLSELLFMKDRRDIERASIFRLVESVGFLLRLE